MLKPFRVYEPESVEDACAFLAAAGPDAVVYAAERVIVRPRNVMASQSTRPVDAVYAHVPVSAGSP